MGHGKAPSARAVDVALRTTGVPGCRFAAMEINTSRPGNHARRAARATSTGTTRPPQGLAALLGTWDFTYSIISTYEDRYVMNAVQTSDDGIPFILAYDVYGGAWTCSLPGRPTWGSRASRTSSRCSMPVPSCLSDVIAASVCRRRRRSGHPSGGGAEPRADAGGHRTARRGPRVGADVTQPRAVRRRPPRSRSGLAALARSRWASGSTATTAASFLGGPCGNVRLRVHLRAAIADDSRVVSSRLQSSSRGYLSRT